MSKYIKRVNWPWVEIEDTYVNPSDKTIVINTDDISAIWNRESGYKWGIKMKDGSWLDHFSPEALDELKDLLMNSEKTKTINHTDDMRDVVVDHAIEYGDQSMIDWLKENGQL